MLSFCRMGYSRRDSWKSIDWFTVLLYVIMIVAGWVTICGASYEYDMDKLFSLSSRPVNQLIWMGISLSVAFSILMIERDFYEVFSYLIYAAIILLLVATIFLAPDIKGSRSWLVLGPIRLQPAEFAKFATALAVARLMGTYGFELARYKNFLMVLGLIFLPMICILLQKETGSALVYLAFFLMLYREGMSGYFLLAGVCAVVYFVTGMKYAEVMMGETVLGVFLVSLLVLFITILLVYVEKKNKQAVQLMSYTSLAVLGISGLISYYYPFNLNIVALSLLGLAVLYLIYLSIHHWVWNYVLIALFAIGSIGFLFSVNYVFTDILEPHQQIRIKVSLGLEDDPSGAGYNVNQSKIAIGSDPDKYNGYDIQPYMGVSMLPIFEGEEQSVERDLCFEHFNEKALIDAEGWKIVQPSDSKTQAWELYDLNTDRSEMFNLASKYPNRVKAMVKRYLEWEKQCKVVPRPTK